MKPYQEIVIRKSRKNRPQEMFTSKRVVHALGEIFPRSDPDFTNMRYYLGPLRLKYIISRSVNFDGSNHICIFLNVHNHRKEVCEGRSCSERSCSANPQ